MPFSEGMFFASVVSLIKCKNRHKGLYSLSEFSSHKGCYQSDLCLLCKELVLLYTEKPRWASAIEMANTGIPVLTEQWWKCLHYLNTKQIVDTWHLYQVLGLKKRDSHPIYTYNIF